MFARSVHAEASAKRLRVDKAANYGLHLALSSRQIAIAEATGLDVIVHDETRQRGETFGERLVSGVRRVACLGYERVLVIGGDCPALTTEHLMRAERQLASRPGAGLYARDARGGTYLLGLNLAALDDTTFARLPWQTARLARALSETAGLDAAELPILFDLNTVTDVSHSRTELCALGFGRFVVRRRVQFWRKPTQSYGAGFGESLPARGPPARRAA